MMVSSPVETNRGLRVDCWLQLLTWLISPIENGVAAAGSWLTHTPSQYWPTGSPVGSNTLSRWVSAIIAGSWGAERAGPSDRSEMLTSQLSEMNQVYLDSGASALPTFCRVRPTSMLCPGMATSGPVMPETTRSG